MSDISKDKVTEVLKALWSNDTQEWNHDQHAVMAGVNNLFLETTTNTKNDLIEQITQLLNMNPEAYSADGSEETASDVRSVLDRAAQQHREKVTADIPVLRIIHSPASRASGGNTIEPPTSSTKAANCMKNRITRLRDRVLWNICHLGRGEALDAHN